ncbi:peptidase M23-like protein [Paenibacillus taihuensis]|uniref:Peptidase M23-like protein n=1 Tax=Paenibacillus taihuensis TaxID=1156355 RepID=A0A3D9SJV0_9BACL|nr:peptidoglycan DD-metalloendopeptidase family protein [Paenibacillus taihuensis]REE90573.1 peptidase M23-like protein [Paenibacillus taihuensis]
MKKSVVPRGKHFTFLVLPDGARPVLRFRVHAILLVLLPIIFVALMAIASTLYMLHDHARGQLDQLHSKLSTANETYSKQLAMKEGTIKQLQVELAQLAQQAESVEMRIEELNKLESDVKSLVGIPEEETGPAEPSEDGVGGEYVAIQDDELEELAHNTSTVLNSLDGEITDLKERLTSTKELAQKRLQTLRVTPTYWPTQSQRITSFFGVRMDPFSGEPGIHKGIDIAGHMGDPVFAAADGRVSDTGTMSERGNYVVVTHAMGLTTRYFHLSRIEVKTGDRIHQGVVIGKVGSSGRSTGPHLHFEVMKRGESVDPRPYLKMAIKGNSADVQVEKRQD